MSSVAACEAWDTFDADKQATDAPRCRFVRPCTREATVEVILEDGALKLCSEHAGDHPGRRPLPIRP